MLRIYTDPQFLPPKSPPLFLLFPFWGKPPEHPEDPRRGRFDRLVSIGRQIFELVATLNEADIAILPANWLYYLEKGAINLAQQFVDLTLKMGKTCVIFSQNDSVEPIPLRGDNLLIFRTALYRSRKNPNEFAYPPQIEDFVSTYFNGVLPLRKKKPKPVISFCGFIGPLNPPLRQRLRWLRDKVYVRLGLREPIGIFYRRKAVKVLQKSKLVETNFIFRESFWGGAANPGQSNYWDFEKLKKVRIEYVQNMVDSDYVLCVRGGGNWSFRLYEALSCGRIPVFVDTDCVLPYDFIIDWRQYCVWVPERELNRIDQIVADFHASLSPDDFVTLQQCCYQFWRERLSPEGFATHFHQHFQINRQEVP